ncbi:alpha-N-acetylgalactosaminide alpha-2,6-sialyltransferase 1-like [Gymnodraco acuticeps]|uniref:alpha-N-acetylgalactosaminide alpha-2,6-sialyltransferase n=1 Tax=Gymnodraco acuticeps TaxID=8218 RepID=A0A6P8TZL4_GYMAC|nr:alpha-N-acetylgalactosaminide alpha-2,6-sialyltransferase 1-like [Gymnodraco acuticeps]
MADKHFQICCVLLLLSVCSVLLFLPWEHSLSRIRWPSLSGKVRHGAHKLFFDLGMEKGNSTPADVLAHIRGVVAETPMPVLIKSSFKKLPEWDFEDIYNQDAPPRQTTCANSLRNSEDESFKKNFLPNIRLYMHKDNVNMSEWNRLSHFNNPFGFMGFNHDDVMTSVKLIPKPKEPLLLPKPGGGCVTCAVVAGAGILNGSKNGKEIDARDYVFRMNGAITKGYEEDVGGRTSVYVHTAHSITSSPYMLRDYGYKNVPNDEGIKYVMIPEGMKDFIWLKGLLKGERIGEGQYKNRRPRTYYAGQYNETRFYVLHQDFLRYVRNRFIKSRGLLSPRWAIVRPTNGAFTLFLALHTCDTVSAYGFMTEDYSKYSNYYYEKIKKRVVFYANHDYLMEKDLWKSLHNTKILKLYQRTNSEQEPEKENKLIQ